MKFNTKREAAEAWVQEFNMIPQSVVEKLMQVSEYNDITEITPPCVYDRVICGGEHSGESGEIISTNYDGEDDLYVISIDGTHEEVILSSDEFDVERDYGLPMWGTMWSFGDSADDWWLEEGNGIEIMSECGFRIYKSDEFGYFFGIDGAGYNFYDAHWIPLYKARGLQWHDPVAEQEYQMLSKGYKKENLGANTYWMDKNNNVIEEVIKEEF